MKDLVSLSMAHQLWKFDFCFTVALIGKDSLTNLAVEAARKALEMAQVDPDDVDLVLMCTSTPEDLFGSAPQV